MFRISESVKHIIIINVIVFLAINIVLKNTTLAEYMVMHFPLNPEFKAWQIFTSMFMHINGSHIFSNMLLLFFLGPMLESVIQKKKFIFLYISAGFGAVLLSTIIDFVQFQSALASLVDSGLDKSDIMETLKTGMYNTSWENNIGAKGIKNLVGNYNSVSLGASGAVMGVVAALGYTLPNEKVYLLFLPFPIKLKYLAFAYVASDFVSAISTGSTLLAGTSVGYIAHIGGAMTGLFIAMYWKKNSFNKYRVD